jgi:hypothetical protein
LCLRYGHHVERREVGRAEAEQTLLLQAILAVLRTRD